MLPSSYKVIIIIIIKSLFSCAIERLNLHPSLWCSLHFSPDKRKRHICQLSWSPIQFTKSPGKSKFGYSFIKDRQTSKFDLQYKKKILGFLFMVGCIFVKFYLILVYLQASIVHCSVDTGETGSKSKKVVN